MRLGVIKHNATGAHHWFPALLDATFKVEDPCDMKGAQGTVCEQWRRHQLPRALAKRLLLWHLYTKYPVYFVTQIIWHNPQHIYKQNKWPWKIFFKDVEMKIRKRNTWFSILVVYVDWLKEKEDLVIVKCHISTTSTHFVFIDIMYIFRIWFF